MKKAALHPDKITPFLWFDKQAAEAARFHTSIFKHSKILSSGPMVTTFLLEGRHFMALNGGPHFRFNEAISFLVHCATQRKGDYYWRRLPAGGEEGQCGSLKDRSGLSWQIIPDILGELLGAGRPGAGGSRLAGHAQDEETRQQSPQVRPRQPVTETLSPTSNPQPTPPMPKYVDGFVVPIPKKNLKAYLKMARIGRKVWMDHGALDYKECIGDDLNVPFGLPFPKGIKLKSGETVAFSFIVYKSKAHRAQVNAKVMKDPRLTASCDPKNTPFDVKRMLYGGFQAVVSA